MVKKLLIVLIIIIIIGYLGYNYLYQDHRDVASSKASAIFSSNELLLLFTDNDVKNDVKALDQVIEIKGLITSVDGKMIILNNNIFVEMLDSLHFKKDEFITIKGRCLGYDDMLEEVKIDQATKQ